MLILSGVQDTIKVLLYLGTTTLAPYNLYITNLQVLRRTSKFVIGNILPGAVEEVGLLCSNIVLVNPKESSV